MEGGLDDKFRATFFVLRAMPTDMRQETQRLSSLHFTTSICKLLILKSTSLHSAKIAILKVEVLGVHRIQQDNDQFKALKVEPNPMDQCMPHKAQAIR